MNQIKNIVRLSKYLKKYYLWFILVLLMLAVVALTNIGITQQLRQATDYAVNKNWSYFIRSLYYLAFTVLLGLLFKYIERYAVGNFISKSIVTLRDYFIKRLLKIRIGELEGKHSGDILSSFSNDMRNVQSFFENHIVNLTYEILITMASFVYLFITNKNITLAIVLIIPVSMVLSNFITKTVGELAFHIQRGLDEANVIVNDTFKGITTVKSFNLEKRFKVRYADAINKCINNGVAIDRKVLYLDLMMIFFQLAPYLIFCLYGGYLLEKGSISIGELVAFLTLFDSLYMSLCEVQYSIKDIKIDMVSINRIIEILNLPIEPETFKEDIGIKEGSLNPIIAFKDLCFSYDNKKEVLKNLNFSINKGETVAILGESGCGKSTVFKLLTKFYTDYSGNIEIMGKSIDTWGIEDLRKEISLVSQDTHLFHQSIKENIRYGRLNASMEEIIEAAKKANAHDFIIKLSRGYETLLEENGSNLSGGERQRISIARAIIKNSPILLLDEATSALDSKTEGEVNLALNELMKDRTTLVITHKLSTLETADKIFLIKEGQLVESSNKSDLIKLNILCK